MRRKAGTHTLRLLRPAPGGDHVSVLRRLTVAQIMVERGETEVWIAAARRGDEFALAKLLTLYYPRLWARADARMDAALKARISPADVVQEVFLDVAQRIDRFDDRGPGAFLAWLHGILSQKLVDARRAAHCQIRDLDREVPAGASADSSSYWNLLDQLYAESGTPSRAVRRQEALLAVARCVSELPDAHRQIIQLRFRDGLSVNEVAKRLRKSEGAVVALTQRALKELRRSLERAGEFTRGP